MSLIIRDNGAEATVATAMSPIVEDGLRNDEFLIEGITYNGDATQTAAGQIQVVVKELGAGVQPKTPGSNFTSREFANTVKNINCNNSFQDSAKLPYYFNAAMPTDNDAEAVDEVTYNCRQGRQQSAIAYLAKNGTLVEAEKSDAITKDNVKNEVIKIRTKMRHDKAKPTVILASVDTYAAMLEAAGDKYTPVTNDQIVTTGQIGRYLGMLWIECNLLDKVSDYQYLDGDGQVQNPTQSAVDFIMYDPQHFFVADVLSLLRFIESEEFAGTKCQMELDAGFLLGHTEAAVVRSTKNV